jgi:POT family proton-dependent oligopeptide transporter
MAIDWTFEGERPAVEPRTWFGHPRGLSVLFFTEMWERFSFYGLRALLILYLVAPNGLHLSVVKAASIYGWYTMLVYAMAIPGGWVADRWLGHYRAVMVGGVIIALGHFCMALPLTQTFFLGLGAIIIGTGLLKPNVSTMVGSLYAPGDPRRDGGFSIFYMGINIGSMIAPLICGWLGQRVNWHLGFGAAGVGMTLGLIQYALGRHHLRAAGPATRAETVQDRTPFTRDDWHRVAVIGILFLFSILFWGAFEQAGSTLTLFADRFTRLSIFGFSFPSAWFQSEQPLFVLVMAPIFAWLWLALGRRAPSSPAKFAYGLLFVGAGFLLLVPAAAAAQSHGVRVSPMWLTAAYFIHTIGEMCLSPVGLSTVTKLAPRRIVGFSMGIWFLATAFGNKAAGAVAGMLGRVPMSTLFAATAAVTLGAAIVLALLRRPVRKLMGGVH